MPVNFFATSNGGGAPDDDAGASSAKRRRAQSMGQLLMQRGSAQEPVYGTGQGLAKIATAAIGGFLERQDADKEAAGHKALNANMLAAIVGGAGGAGPAPSFGMGGRAPSGAAATAQGGDRPDVASLKAALAPMESGGRYDIKGPLNAKYGAPLGKYQIMASNLPEWSQAALGRTVSADEFLKNPDLQEQIAGHRMGLILDKYGNLQDAASVWHSGRPLAQATAAGARDVNMSTADYVARTVGRQRVAATSGAPAQAAPTGGYDPEFPGARIAMVPNSEDPGTMVPVPPARPQFADMPAQGAIPTGQTAMGDQDGFGAAPGGFVVPPGPQAPPPPVDPDRMARDPLPTAASGTMLPEITVEGPAPPLPPLPPPRPADLAAAVGAGAPPAAQAPLPPARPELADAPGPGAREASAQTPSGAGWARLPGPPLMVSNPLGGPDLSNSRDAGALAFATGAPGGGPASLADLVRGGGSSSAPQPAPQRLAQAVAGGGPSIDAAAPGAPAGGASQGGNRGAALAAIISSPYASDGMRTWALGQLTPKAGEAFTLGEGQVRYGPNGQVIAQAPGKIAKPDEYTLSPGQRRMQGDRVIAETPASTPEGFDTETKLRSEFNGRTRDYAAVHDAYGRVLSAVQPREGGQAAKSPASDIALVYGYMKMLDPGSVVREGEFATAQNAGGIPERIQNIYNKAIRGEFLTTEQRQDMVDSANRLYSQTRRGVEGEAERYRGLSRDYKVDPGRVVRLPDALAAPSLKAPVAAPAPAVTAAPPTPAPTPAAASPVPSGPAADPGWNDVGGIRIRKKS